MTTVTYEWEIVLRNDRMGFAKQFRPVAATLDNAVGVALEELAGIRSKSHPDKPAYNVTEFACVSAIRRTRISAALAEALNERGIDPEGSDG
jgi:hypothetical protein